MRYKGKVYRPPSEAYSLIVQVTYGCSHNTCAFCDMYDDKHFAMRPMNEIREDFEMARQLYRHVERVFLADGDALMRKTDDLVQILGLIYGLFPECQRVTCYASPASLQVKSEDDLRLLRERGLQMVYMGLESGCDAVLERMRKGHSAAAIVAAGQKARRCGMALSPGALHADRAGGNHDVTAADILLHAAAGAYADESVSPAVGQLFQRDGSGRAADAGAGNADGYAVEGASVSNELAAVSHQTRVIKIFGNFGAALGVAGQKHIAAHIAGTQPDMILLAAAFGIIDHRFQPPE